MSRLSLLRRALVLGLAWPLLSACQCQKETPHDPKTSKSRGQNSESPVPEQKPPSETSARQALLDGAARCSLRQRGLVLDLGDAASEALRDFRIKIVEPPLFTERMGESLRRLDAMNTDFVFWLSEEMKDFELEARVHGLGSERVAAYIDGVRIGSAALAAGQTQTVIISGKNQTVAPGRHKLTLGLSRPRGGEPEAEIGWVRVGAPRTSTTDFAPTRREVFSEVTIDEERRKSVVLRSEGSVRCPLWVPPETAFETHVGVWGEGEGEVEIIVHTLAGERFVVASHKRKDDEPRAFQTLTADLSQFGGKFVDLELSAPRSLKRARMALGDPTLISATEKVATAPRARRALVVLLSGLSSVHAPPQAAQNGLPLLNQLAQEGTTFTDYRATSTSVLSTLASILTGTAPWEHRMETPRATLPPKLVSVATTIEGQGGRTAFFTGVPWSFEPFGLNRGFERFVSVAPQEDRPATEPITLAKDWLKTQLSEKGPILTVIHLRGAHPPFDITPEKAAELPPAEYGGDLSPRRAAIRLGEIRAREASRHRQMPKEDWLRFDAMQKAALLKQNSELGELISWLRARGAYDDTLLIVAGDVGAGERPDIPFSDDADLLETYLSVPLLIKFPGGYLRGAHVPGNFAPRDLTTTIFQSLGLTPPIETDGIDLGASDAPRKVALRPHIAYRDDAYSVRLGEILMIGKDGKPPRICSPSLDPECHTDRTGDHSLEGHALWLSTWHTLSSHLGAAPPISESLAEDLRQENAFIVWGANP